MTRTKLINELEKNLNQKITAYLLECLEGEDETRFSEHSIAAIKETALKEKYYGAEAYYHHLINLKYYTALNIATKTKSLQNYRYIAILVYQSVHILDNYKLKDMHRN